MPDYICGRLIGRGGASIKEICNISNCKVKLHDKLRSDNDSEQDLEFLGGDENSSMIKKRITLNGTIEQIARAKVNN